MLKIEEMLNERMNELKAQGIAEKTILTLENQDPETNLCDVFEEMEGEERTLEDLERLFDETIEAIALRSLLTHGEDELTGRQWDDIQCSLGVFCFDLNAIETTLSLTMEPCE